MNFQSPLLRTPGAKPTSNLFASIFWLLFAAIIAVNPEAFAQKPSNDLRVKSRQNPEAKTVDFLIGDQVFTTFDYGTNQKPILYPIYGPDQIGMTRNWPMKKDVAGEAHDHPHHKSMWVSHIIDGTDFWSEKQGKVDVKKVETAFSGDSAPDNALRTTSDWIRKSDGKKLLSDQTTFWFGGNQNMRWIDCRIDFMASEGPVVMDDTKEGLFAIRTHPDLRLKPSKKHGVDKVFGAAINSEGVKGVGIWGKKAKWLLYQGPIDGTPVSIAMFDHPSNLRHPTTWHARDYGLVTANPFGLHYFEGLKKGAGAYKIKSGESLVLRYRIEFWKGLSTVEQIEASFENFATKTLPNLTAIGN